MALGFYYYWGLMNYEKALEEFSIAQKTIPNDLLLLTGLASIHKRQGNFQAALKGNRRTLELDPRNAAAALELGIVYSLIAQYAEAQRYFDLSISIAPDATGGYEYKIDNFLKWTGDTKRARALIIKIPDEDVRNEYFRFIEWLDRNYQGALKLLPVRSQKGYMNAIQAGWCYRLMNNTEKAGVFYDAARIELENLLQKGSDKAELHSSLSLMPV
jgi:tetratricopeptide (TPR) repeat protein